jgi:hypothetical protein
MLSARIRHTMFMVGLASLSMVLTGQSAFANDVEKTRSVNCAHPNASIQKEVDKIDHGRPTIIFINGQCEEDVLVEKDDVTLSGNQDEDGTIDGGITGTIIVRGARRVRVEYLHITGPGSGVEVTEGATATIAHSELIDNVNDGVTVSNGGYAHVNFNTITGNGRPAPFFEAGIDVYVNGTVRSRGNYIAGNHYSAVEVGNASYFRSGISAGSGPPNPDDRDIIIQKGCIQGAPANSCGAADTNAVECYRSGTCDFRNSDITGFVPISGLSNFDVRSIVTINGNVTGSGGAQLHLRSGVSGSGFVSCFSRAFTSSAIPCFSNIPPPPP